MKNSTVKKMKKRMLALLLCIVMMMNGSVSVLASETTAEENEVVEMLLDSLEAAHQHTDECYAKSKVSEEPICGKEVAEGHSHGDTCYEVATTQEFTCTLEETAGHSHGDGCFTTVENNVCGQSEHVHGSGCYETEESTEAVCGESEHSHSGDCFTSETVNVCGQEEKEAHAHGDGCYTTTETKTQICTLEETAAHTHGDECYEWSEELICTIPVETADVEPNVQICETCQKETCECEVEETVEICEVCEKETCECETEEAEPIALTTEVDGTTITLSGPAEAFTEGMVYSIEAAIVEAEQEVEVIEEVLEEVAVEQEKVVKSYQAFDIKIIESDEEGNVTDDDFQPLNETPVMVTFSSKEVAESVENEETETSVLHVDTEKKEAEDMAAEVTEDKDVAIETTHFSIYVFVDLVNIGEITLNVEHWVKWTEDGEYEEGNPATIKLPNGFVGDLESLVSVCVSDDYAENSTLEKICIQSDDGDWRTVDDEEILILAKDTNLKLEYLYTYEKAPQLNVFTKPGVVKLEETIRKDKTADDLDENDQTNVTLSVSGDEKQLGVDIIYIAGAGAARQELLEGKNIMINCLMDTFSEIIAQGTQVNFGIVPFSSTSHAVLDLTPLKTQEDLESLPEKIADAFEKAIVVYDGVNMENALLKAKQMFETSELKNHPERQHLVMISSGLTYFFNGGENNENVSAVPVRFKMGNIDSNSIFYTAKAWQRARTNSTNTYPIPKVIIQAYNKEKPAGITLWEYYWNYIDMWAKADIAAGDKGRYDATTVAEGNFVSWFNNSASAYPNGHTFRSGGYGAYITTPTPGALENTYVFDMALGGTDYGPNPLVYGDVAHAIMYERAMWEAYNYLQDNITGKGISFYPIYNRLNDISTNGYVYNGYADQFIGHSFMNMLAGGKAVEFSETDNRAFFDPIKRSILYSVSAGSYVEDYIGYNRPDTGNFDFIQYVEDENGNIKDVNEIIKLNYRGKDYTTTMLDTPNSGATRTYTFKAPDKDEPTFTLNYYYGNGTTTERFVWTFGEHISKFVPVTLTYKLQLKDKVQEVEKTTTFTVDTNLSATLYPINSDDNKRNPEDFPVPKVQYTVEPPYKWIRILKEDIAEGIRLEGAEFALFDELGTTQIDLNPETAQVDGVITDGNGVAAFQIKRGTYKLREMKAPSGYTLLDKDYTIIYGDNGVEVLIDNEKAENVSAEKTEEGVVGSIIEVTIKNIPLYELPSTGGYGSFLYTLSGAALVLGSSLMKYKKKREEELGSEE